MFTTTPHGHIANSHKQNFSRNIKIHEPSVSLAGVTCKSFPEISTCFIRYWMNSSGMLLLEFRRSAPYHLLSFRRESVRVSAFLACSTKHSQFTAATKHRISSYTTIWFDSNVIVFGIHQEIFPSRIEKTNNQYCYLFVAQDITESI